MEKCSSVSFSNFLGAYINFFAIIGVVVFPFLMWKCIIILHTILKVTLLSKLLGLSVNVLRMGQWAVVTGCTDGIGKSYAQELAKRGCNIVLVSRSIDKLTALSADLERDYKVRTRVIVADFASRDVYENIRDKLHGLDIGVLVNNVGQSDEYPDYFLGKKGLENHIDRLININVAAVSFMTAIVLPGMVQKRKGAIVNVSSFAGVLPIPLQAVYSATKVYVNFLSRALDIEYGSKGIVIQTLCPLFVTSKLSKIRNASLSTPSPSKFVRSALDRLGVVPYSAGYWVHEVQMYIVQSVPEWIRNKLILSFNCKIRARALKKASQKVN